MKGWSKFIIVFAAVLGMLLVAVPMFTGIQLNTMMALLFAGISGLAGFFVVLNHHNIVKGKHSVFVIGFMIMIAAVGLLYGSISVPTKAELYWQLTPQMMTFVVLLLIVGFALTIWGAKRMISRN